MFKNYRNGSFALGLAIFLGAFALAYLVFSPLESKRDEANYHAYATTKAKADASEVYYDQCRELASADQIIQCIDEHVKTQGDTQRAQEDLHAQKQMANAAWWMLIVAGFVGVLTILVTIVGVYWVRETYTATKEMVRDTKRIGEAQTRAYVNVQPNSFNEYWNIGTSTFPEVHFDLKNFGNSPARDVRVACRLDVEDVFFPENDSPLFEIGQSDGELSDTIMSGDTVVKSAYGETYLNEDFFDTLFMNSLLKLCIYGIVFYKDVFDQPRETRFCYSANVSIVGMSGEDRVSVTGWRKEHRHNEST